MSLSLLLQVASPLPAVTEPVRLNVHPDTTSVSGHPLIDADRGGGQFTHSTLMLKVEPPAEVPASSEKYIVK